MFSPKTPLISFLFLFILLQLLSEKCMGQAGYKAPPNCARYECPAYTVVHTETEYEIRAYNDALWVSSPIISANSYAEAADKGFRILFAYYRGGNSANVNISLTTPVLVDVRSSRKQYVVYFYVPQQYQNGLPRPLTPLIKPVRLPKFKYVAVRRYGGFDIERLPQQVAFLKKSLTGTPYRRAAALNFVTSAVYNPPFETKKRVNEVFLWFDRFA